MIKLNERNPNEGRVLILSARNRVRKMHLRLAVYFTSNIKCVLHFTYHSFNNKGIPAHFTYFYIRNICAFTWYSLEIKRVTPNNNYRVMYSISATRVVRVA